MFYAVLLLSVFYSCYGADSTTEAAPSANVNAFDQTIDAQLIADKDSVSWDSRRTDLTSFLSVYGPAIHTLKKVTFTGLTNKLGEVLVDSISESMRNQECSIVSLAFKGIRNEDCPSMQREERKRTCKLSRESVLARLVDVFSRCPLEELSVEGNDFALTGLIDLSQNVSKGLFPSMRVLNVDDNNYNFDSVALPRLMRVIASMPQVDVRSFYVGTLNVLKHNHNEDTPFRYNFETRYPAKCEFYSEPIKNEEFELLVQYQPCLYASDLLAHGTSRGAPWVEYMTTMFREGVYANMKNMEIFGNDLFKGDMPGFLATLTAEHFPALEALDMSSNGLSEIRFTKEMVPSLEKLFLDTNGLKSVVVDAGGLPHLKTLKLGYNHLTELDVGEGAMPALEKLYLDNNELSAEVMRAVVEAPFAKTLTILSLFNNPTIAEDAETFVSILTKAMEEHRFASMKMLYMGQCGLKPYCKQIEAVAKKNIPTLRHINCF